MTSINDFAKAVTDMLEDYSLEVAAVAKEAIDEVADGVDKEVKKHITFNHKHTGKYKEKMDVVTSYEGLYDYRKTWHVRWPQSNLTHLLEYSHLSRDGTTRVKAYPHIRYGEEYAEKNLEKVVKRRIEQIKHKRNT